MTRVNLIDVALLTDQHLFAEYREITRVLVLALQAGQKHSFASIKSKIPTTYRLNTGHVLFFYDKLAFIERRYFALRDELLKRQVNITLKDSIVDYRQQIDMQFYGDFKPTQTDVSINIDRIIEKIIIKPNWYRHCGELIDDHKYQEQLKQYLLTYHNKN